MLMIHSYGVTLMGIVSSPDGTYIESDPRWGWFGVWDRSADGHTKQCFFNVCRIHSKALQFISIIDDRLIYDCYKQANFTMCLTHRCEEATLHNVCQLFTKYSHNLCTIWSIPSSEFDDFAFYSLQLKPEDTAAMYWYFIGAALHL